MSIVEYPVPQVEPTSGMPASVSADARRLHRLAEVRRAQGVSRRTLARRLNIDVHQVTRQEKEDADLSLSELYRWQEVLDVPVSELLVESNDPLSLPVMKRAQLVRLMKTAAAIMERSQQVGIRRMAQVLVEQLTEIMPELAGVHPWHAVGKRRSQDELGIAAERGLWTDFLHELPD
jgi:transcriptional regulator with XRE-family HTH domain